MLQTGSSVLGLAVLAVIALVIPNGIDRRTHVTPLDSGGRVCRNSYLPQCGPFRWDPTPPANQPLVMEVTWSPRVPAAGEHVVFTIKLSDPDAAKADLTQEQYGAGTPLFTDCALVGGPRPHGPWTPPEPKQVKITLTRTRVYDSEGTYQVELSAGSYTQHSCGMGNIRTQNVPDPYMSRATKTFKIKVLAR
jgi:hypothetical protein